MGDVPFSDPHRGSVPTRLVRGAAYVPTAFFILLGARGLKRYAIAPMLINIVLLALMLWSTFWASSTLTRWLFGDAQGVLAWMTWMVVLGVLVVAGYGMFFVTSTILASPFIDYLSLRTEENEHGIRHDAEPFALPRFLGDVVYGLSHTLLNVAVYLAVMLPLFAINLVPTVGSLVYTVLGGLATAIFAAREFMDAPASRRRVPYKTKLANVTRNWSVCLGFGAAVGLLLAIPLVNFLVVPVAVVGGTRLFLHLEHFGHLDLPDRS